MFQCYGGCWSPAARQQHAFAARGLRTKVRDRFYYDVEAEARPLLMANYNGLTGMMIFFEVMNKYVGDYGSSKFTDIISI